MLITVLQFESIERFQTGYLNKLLPHVPQKFLRVGTADKAELLLTSLQSNVKRKLPTIVFCNKSSTSNYVGHFLKDQGVPHIRVNGKMPRIAHMQNFIFLQYLKDFGFCELSKTFDAEFPVRKSNKFIEIYYFV